RKRQYIVLVERRKRAREWRVVQPNTKHLAGATIVREHCHSRRQCIDRPDILREVYHEGTVLLLWDIIRSRGGRGWSPDEIPVSVGGSVSRAEGCEGCVTESKGVKICGEAEGAREAREVI
ncbi:hypothetical protein DXG01_005336, partial [Tephrocybe rancida]